MKPVTDAAISIPHRMWLYPDTIKEKKKERKAHFCFNPEPKNSGEWKRIHKVTGY